MTEQEPAAKKDDRSEFAESVRRGMLIGAATLLLVLPPAIHYAPHASRGAPAAAPGIRHIADFGDEPASGDARRLAAWIADSGDNAAKSFAILDKKDAKVFLFDPDGHLKTAAPALLGSARGDDTFPGVGDKPIKDVLPEEKTTPAGRFVAEVGQSSTRGEDVVWVDYAAAVSMHRIIKVPERLQALATPTPDDNRMSFGCINLPDAFYEKSLRPAADRGLVIYVLPETRPLKQTFASFYDVATPSRLAQH
jgi:hypothetical protein